MSTPASRHHQSELAAAKPDGRPPRWYFRLSSKIIIWFVLAALGPVMVAGWVSMVTVKSSLLKAIMRDPPVESQIFGQEVTAGLETLYDAVETLSQSAVLRQFIQAQTTSGDPADDDSAADLTDQVADEFQRLADAAFEEEEFALYTKFRYVDLSGQELVSVNIDPAGDVERVPAEELTSIADQEYFQQAVKAETEEPQLSPVEFNRDVEVEADQDPHSSVMRLSLPVADDNGIRRGLLIVNYDPEFLFETFYPDNNLFAPVNLETIDELKLLIDADGYFISYPDLAKRWGGASGLGTGASVMTEFPEVGREIFNEQLDAKVAAEFEEMKSRPSITLGQTAVPGITKLLHRWAIHYRPIFPNPDDPDRYWLMVFVVPGKLVTSPVSNLQIILLLTTVMAVAVILFLSVQAARSIARPVIELQRAVDIIDRGNLNHQVVVAGHDEISQLGRAFNRMTLKLKESYASLEAKVEQRTQDLRKFQQAVESSTDGVMMMTAAGEIVYVNPAWERQTGRRLDEVMGRRPEIMVSPDTPSAVLKEMNRCLAGGIAFHSENIINRRPDGSQYEIQLSIAPIEEHGYVMFFVALQQDITRRKEVDRAKTEFVSLASHQLRTPLSTINWYTEMLLAGDVGQINQQQRGYLQEIYDGNKRMVELVGDLLNVSRLELGTFVVEPQPTKVAEVIHRTLFDVAAMIKDKKLSVTESYTKQTPTLLVDPKLLSIIAVNLISNAVKYTPAQGRVTISTEVAKAGELRLGRALPFDSYLLQVADTGFGIPPGQQDQIFTKLFRADNVRERVVEGTGLGMYMVKTILGKTGGQIWFSSKENQGTTFIVALPLTGMPPKKGTKSLSAAGH